MLGGNLGGSVTGGLAGNTLGGTLGTALGDGALGSGVGSALGSLGSTSLGSITGASLGSSLGGSLGQSILPKAGAQSNQVPPFSPTRSGQMALPPSLSQLGGLDPNQQASNIATQGVYGGGNGPQESQYFLNLINRQLTDPTQGGGQSQGLGGLSPVDNSFLSQLGLGGAANSNKLLQNIQNYKFS